MVVIDVVLGVGDKIHVKNWWIHGAKIDDMLFVIDVVIRVGDKV